MDWRLFIMNINDLIHGFRITNIRHVDEIDADLFEMVHEKTRAKALWLKRDDDNKTFSIAFKTTPDDDTGVFHILEHSVLNGSKRYPVREPFVDLLKGSLQTFLNAMTYPDKTVYPVSSKNNKDFINLMRVYLDAVFEPIAVKNPNIFRQEGWHYELLEADKQPIYKGVVLNEMKGAFSSPDSVKARLLMHALFPDNCYGNESGGDPDHITDLTYQQFCDAHHKYYSPSNSFICLDGDMNIDEILGIIDDEYLSHYTSEGEVITINKQQPVISEPVRQKYEISPEDSPEGKAHISYGYVVGDYDDYMSNMAFSLIASVLCSTNESPLKKAILSKGLGEDITFSIEDGMYQPFVAIDVVNTDVEKEPEITATILAELRKAVENGLDKDELEASLNIKEFKAKERDFGGAPKGLVFSLSSLDSWLYGGDPLDGIVYDRLFTELRNKISTSYYEDLINDLILNSNHKAEVILEPCNTLGAEKLEKEKAKLAEIASSWSKEEREELVRMNQQLIQWQSTEDTPEQQATLPVLHLSDLKDTPSRYDLTECLHGGTNTVLKHEINTNGISYVTVYSDVCDLSLQQYSQLSVLLSLLGQISTENYDTIHLGQQMKKLLGSFNQSFVATTDVSTQKDRYLVDISFSSLHRFDQSAVELVREILYRTRFDDKQAIRDIIRQSKMALEQGLIGAGHSFGVLRISAFESQPAAATEYYSGYENYKYLKNLEENWDELSDQLIADIRALYEKLFVKERLMISVTSDDKPAIVKAIIDTAPKGEKPVPTEKPVFGHRREAIVTPSNVSYACMGGRMSDELVGNNGAMYVVSNILTYDYLWTNVRVKGGAYGCGYSARVNNFARFHSYRDPSPLNSLTIFKATPDYLKQFCEGDQDVEKYIVGTTGEFDPYASTFAQIKTSDIEYFRGISYQDKADTLKQILATTKQDIMDLIPAFEQINEKDNICVIGNRDAIEQCGEQIDEILTM